MDGDNSFALLVLYTPEDIVVCKDADAITFKRSLCKGRDILILTNHNSISPLKLYDICSETGKTLAQIALKWLLQRPTVTSVIFGARTEEQLRSNLEAVGWELSGDQIARLDAASEKPLVYPYWHQRAAASAINPPPV